MKKLMLLLFMIIIAGLSVFVYESYRNPHIQVALPDRHGLTAGSPLLYRTIEMGTIQKLKQDEAANQVALVKVKGDMFSLLHENDTFVVRDRALHVMPAKQPGKPLERNTLLKSTIYQGVMATIQDIGREVGTVIKDSSRSLIAGQLDKLKEYVNQQADKDLEELGTQVRQKVEALNDMDAEEFRRQVDNTLDYLQTQSAQLYEQGHEAGADILQRIKQELARDERAEKEPAGQEE